MNELKETPPPQKKDPKENWSRNTKRESKRLDLFMRKLVMAYISSYQMKEDKNSEKLVTTFNKLDKKWKAACHKKWSGIVPKKEAFERNVEHVLKNIEKVEKQKAETYLKSL